MLRQFSQFFAGREDSGTPTPFGEKSNIYIFERVYEILPPHLPPDWDNIQTIPQNPKGRAPLRERVQKFALPQCIIGTIHKEAHFVSTSARLKCTYFAPGPFMMKVFLLVAH